jgi:hypothetical protein
VALQGLVVPDDLLELVVALGFRAGDGGGSPADALVVGFHWAFAAGAVFTLAALTVMVVLLRKRHVAASRSRPPRASRSWSQAAQTSS